MPQTFQEWIALSLVALTIGFVLGRWLSKRRAANLDGNPQKSSDCSGCPQSKPKPAAFKNIPIDVTSGAKPKTPR